MGDSSCFPAEGSSPSLTEKTTKALPCFPLFAQVVSLICLVCLRPFIATLLSANQSRQEGKENRPLNFFGDH